VTLETAIKFVCHESLAHSLRREAVHAASGVFVLDTASKTVKLNMKADVVDLVGREYAWGPL
jgi:hypothetical protein